MKTASFVDDFLDGFGGAVFTRDIRLDRMKLRRIPLLHSKKFVTDLADVNGVYLRGAVAKTRVRNPKANACVYGYEDFTLSVGEDVLTSVRASNCQSVSIFDFWMARVWSAYSR